MKNVVAGYFLVPLWAPIDKNQHFNGPFERPHYLYHAVGIKITTYRWFACRKHGKPRPTLILKMRQNSISATFYDKHGDIKRKRKRYDPALWQKPLHPQKTPKSKVTTQKRHHKRGLHDDCGPTKDGQLEWRQTHNWCGETGLRDPNIPTHRNSRVIKRTRRYNTYKLIQRWIHYKIWSKMKWNTFINYKHIKSYSSLKFVYNFDIKNSNAPSISQQAWYRLRTVNCTHAIGVFRPCQGIPIFPLTTKVV